MVEIPNYKKERKNLKSSPFIADMLPIKAQTFN